MCVFGSALGPADKPNTSAENVTLTLYLSEQQPWETVFLARDTEIKLILV